jgi:signal peptidase I
MIKPVLRHSTANGSKTQRNTRRSLMRAGLRWVERGLAVFGGIVALYWCTLDLSVVVSPSMSPTLQGTNVHNGDRVLTEKITRWFRTPARWEVITFIDKTGEKRMKRVAGLPGESVQMLSNGDLLVDGERVDVPQTLNLKYLRYGNLMDGKPVACGNGFYVLGDDLKDSDDSRFNGPVAAEDVLGRAWLIVWPSTRAGFIE